MIRLPKEGWRVPSLPPADVGLGVQRQRFYRGIRVPPDLVVEAHDVIAGLVRAHPHVGAVPDRAILLPRQGELRRPPDARPEVGPLNANEVLDQTENVRAARRERAPRVVLTQFLERAQRRVASLLQVLLQGAGQGVRHRSNLSTPTDWVMTSNVLAEH